MATYPHCDSEVLHAPGECKYCDMYPDAQAARQTGGINFTGHSDEDKAPCPSEVRRPLERINRWGGNVPVPEGMTTIMHSPHLVTEEKADEYWASLREEFDDTDR